MCTADIGTAWSLLNRKNRIYLICRLYDKAIDSAKFQLSFKVLTLHFTPSEPMQPKWTKNRCPPLPETWLHLHRAAVCWPGVSSFTPKTRVPTSTPVSFFLNYYYWLLHAMTILSLLSPAPPPGSQCASLSQPEHQNLPSITSMTFQWIFPLYPEMQVCAPHRKKRRDCNVVRKIFFFLI